jgi:glycosyltransferase involved in cell wall biosynthesis
MTDTLLVNYEYPPIGAGAANATYHTARALVQLGIHPVVITAAFGESQGVAEEDGVTVYRIPALRRHANKANLLEMATYMISLAMNLRRLYKRQKISRAIVYFSFPCGPIGLLLRFFYKTPYIVSLRGGDVPGTEPGLGIIYWILTPLRRLVFKKSEAVIANSVGLAELSMKADPYPVQVVPNGVDSEFWRPELKSEDQGIFNILFVGRFHPQKNLHFLVREFVIFHKKNPDARLLLVGDGPERDSLKKLALESGVSNDITFAGWAARNELRARYQSANCLVNPSHYEGMPNVLLEAMACGAPVIASNVPGNNEVVQNGKTGLLFEANNSAEFQSSLTLIKDGGNKIREMVQSARARMTNEYDWKSVSRLYLDYFQENRTKTSGGPDT